jgi:hypothetical protein
MRIKERDRIRKTPGDRAVDRFDTPPAVGTDRAQPGAQRARRATPPMRWRDEENCQVAECCRAFSRVTERGKPNSIRETNNTSGRGEPSPCGPDAKTSRSKYDRIQLQIQ